MFIHTVFQFVSVYTSVKIGLGIYIYFFISCLTFKSFCFFIVVLLMPKQRTEKLFNDRPHKSGAVDSAAESLTVYLTNVQFSFIYSSKEHPQIVSLSRQVGP